LTQYTELRRRNSNRESSDRKIFSKINFKNPKSAIPSSWGLILSKLKVIGSIKKFKKIINQSINQSISL
jgi:hypothetical protein